MTTMLSSIRPTSASIIKMYRLASFKTQLLELHQRSINEWQTSRVGRVSSHSNLINTRWISLFSKGVSLPWKDSKHSPPPGLPTSLPPLATSRLQWLLRSTPGHQPTQTMAGLQTTQYSSSTQLRRLLLSLREQPARHGCR
eukprot:12408837-Karenia_brevis.AAC.1